MVTSHPHSTMRYSRHTKPILTRPRHAICRALLRYSICTCSKGRVEALAVTCRSDFGQRPLCRDRFVAAIVHALAGRRRTLLFRFSPHGVGLAIFLPKMYDSDLTNLSRLVPCRQLIICDAHAIGHRTRRRFSPSHTRVPFFKQYHSSGGRGWQIHTATSHLSCHVHSFIMRLL